MGSELSTIYLAEKENIKNKKCLFVYHFKSQDSIGNILAIWSFRGFSFMQNIAYFASK